MLIIWLIVIIVCSVSCVTAHIPISLNVNNRIKFNQTVLSEIIFKKTNTQNIKPYTISINNTKINGQIKSFNGTDVGVFYGIPYAQPTIGALRFKEPKPIEKWPDVINALDLPVACVQLTSPLFPFSTLENGGKTSEDCLYLNIWTPIKNQNILKTVMFWIHGGAHIYGSSNTKVYEATVLSAMGDVVVVSINYRLGIFGYLYTGTDIGPGNVGLRDQILAIQWVKNNIKQFGGDPNKITLFGESAGSMDTGALILSPASRQLFKRAIMMSGGPLGLTNVYKRDVVLTYWNAAAKLVNCTDNGFNVSTSLSPIVIECLQNTPAEKLIYLSINPLISPGLLIYEPYFVTDGVILTDSTLNLIEQGQFNQDLEILFGYTSNEGTIFLPLFGGLELFSPTNPGNLSYSAAFALTKQLTSILPLHKPVNTDELAKLYFTGISEQSDPVVLRQAIGQVIGDFIVTCPSILFARALFERYKQSIKVYQYVYNSKLGTTKLDCTDWMGVCHGQDIIPVFGYPFTHLNTSLDREKQVSVQMIKIFTDFAKTGKTTPQNGQEWHSYYQINNITTAPYYEITNDEKTSNVKTGNKLTECLNLWKFYFY